MSAQWKLVPVEPTESMVINGFESVPDECFSDEEVWEQYQEMSGCQQAAFRAKLCWAAMIASAPAPGTHIAVLEESAAVDFGIDGRSVLVSQEAYSIFLAREASGREKIAALQQRLTAADERVDVLEGLLRDFYLSNSLSVRQMQRVHAVFNPAEAALTPAEGRMPSTCTWSEDGFSWHTGCGKEWQFTDGGLPSDNGMRFCHSCGKTLVVEDTEDA